jgi:predicted dehydrogenase
MGTLERIEVAWSVQTYANLYRTTSWKTSPAEGGGPLFAFASHALYYLEWFSGPIASLRCRCERSPQDPREVDTQVFLDARFQTGATARVRIDTDATLRQEHSLRFQSGEGTLILQNTSKDYIQGFRLYAQPTGGSDFIERIPSSVWEVNFPVCTDGRILATGSLAQRLVQWVQGRSVSQPDFSAGHRVQQLLSLAAQSHLSGGVWEDVHTF